MWGITLGPHPDPAKTRGLRIAANRSHAGCTTFFTWGLFPWCELSQSGEPGLPMRILEGERTGSQHMGKWAALLHYR